jgi:hypothetical protein
VAQIGPGDTLEQGDAGGVRVRGLRGVVAGDPAQGVLGADQGEQALLARAQGVGVRHPVGSPVGQRGVVPVADDDQGPGRHTGETRVQEGQVLGRERGQVGAARPRRREEDAGRDPRVGQVVLLLPGHRVEDAQSQEVAGRLAAEGVPGRGDTVPVDMSAEAGDGGLQRVEVVQDALHVLDPRPPQPRRAGVVLGQADGTGVEVGGLDHHEAVRGPEVGQRPVAVQRGAVAVGEENDGECAPGHVDVRSKRRRPPGPEASMRIGELAALTGVSVRALRYYEEQELLAAERGPGGRRRYPDDAVDRVRLIQRLYAAGLSSRTIRELLPRAADRRPREHPGRTGRGDRPRHRQLADGPPLPPPLTVAGPHR